EAINSPLPKGRLVLVHFWSISSESSTTNMPVLAELRDRRKRRALRLIAIHLPLRPAERDARAVRDAASRLNLTEPCALDKSYTLRDAFLDANDDVPAYYLFDIEHRLRSSATGENGLAIIEDELTEMLRELRDHNPFCPQCELFLNPGALYCAD